MPRFTVSAVYLGALIEGARRAGADLSDLQLPENTDSFDTRIPRLEANALWEELPRRVGDDDFGLHLAERLEPGALAVLDFAARNAPTLRQAYLRVVRYVRLMHDAVEVALDETDPRGAVLSYTLPQLPSGSPRHAAEFTLGILICSGRQMTDERIVPRAVGFQHPLPQTGNAEHRRLFGCPISFEQPRNEIIFAPSALDLAVVGADPKLATVLNAYADELLARLPRPQSFAARVQRLLAKALRGGDPSLEAIAGEVKMSARTVQRKLKDDGTSHQELLDELRREMAHRYLAEPHIAIGEAAFLLGFSEPSAFHRAFKRWTGKTPGEYRRQALAS
ncbi:MAG: AraC family transcriptional regulator [Deltaproteobacteria bacterium]|nr:AraC family transcriptional regulator [Deltaproteobacteria bacterium]